MDVVEIALGTYSTRGRIARLSRLSEVADVAYDKGLAAWRSYFVFGEDGADHIRTKGHMDMSFQGDIRVQRILLDYESPGDTEGSDEILREIRYVIRHLSEHLDVEPSWIRPWFSGRRGFHLELPNLFGIEPSPDAPDLLKVSVEQMLGHPMLDTKPLFKAGLIRLENSLHTGSGLYKTPLLLPEIFRYSYDEIREIAQHRRENFEFPPVEEFTPIWKKSAAKTTRRRQFGIQRGKEQLRYDPTRVVTCMQHLINRGAEKGRRNKDLLRLASWTWKGGIPEEWAVDNLVRWASTAGDEGDAFKWEETVRRSYASKYLYGCNDEVMSEFCDPSCIFYRKKGYVMDIDTPRSLADKYRDFIKKMKNDRAGVGFSAIAPKQAAEYGSYRIIPGEVLMITGDTGMAKTMFVQNLVTRARKPTLWLNLEMSGHLNFRRFVQIHTGMSKHQVEEFFEYSPELEVQKVLDELDWLRQESIAPDIAKVEAMIMQTDPEIVVVDTTDAILVDGVGSNSNLHLRKVMEAMRVLAERYEVVVICIHHITKSASRSTSEGMLVGESLVTRDLSLNDLTGDRSNVTKVDHVFAIEGRRETNVRKLRSLKTRDGAPVKYAFEVNWKNFQFQEIA